MHHIRRFGGADLSLLLLLLCLCLQPLFGQSLHTATSIDDGTLYSDQVARQTGDLITIRVVESMQLEEKQETSRERENSANIAFTQAPFTTRLSSTSGEATGTLPGLAISSSKEFEGEGEFRGSGRMTFTLGARVIDVLDNGNLVIQARRTLTIQDDTKTVLLTGICRRADIDPGNSVASTSLHNFEVSVEGEGPLSRTQQEGILGRLLDIVWPF